LLLIYDLGQLHLWDSSKQQGDAQVTPVLQYHAFSYDRATITKGNNYRYMIKRHQNKRKPLAKQVTYISASTAAQTSGTSICRDVTDDPHHTLPVLAAPNQCGFSLFTLSPTADKSFGIKKLHLKKTACTKNSNPFSNFQLGNLNSAT
jgi:hypothetical protein